MNDKVTGADIAPFIAVRPEAAVLVNVAGRLVPIRDVYYDNEYGYHVIELAEDAPEVSEQ